MWLFPLSSYLQSWGAHVRKRDPKLYAILGWLKGPSSTRRAVLHRTLATTDEEKKGKQFAHNVNTFQADEKLCSVEVIIKRSQIRKAEPKHATGSNENLGFRWERDTAKKFNQR